jgi:hypothetical protein
MIPKEVKFYCQLKILYTFLIDLIRRKIEKPRVIIIKVIIDTLLYNHRSAIEEKKYLHPDCRASCHPPPG